MTQAGSRGLLDTSTVILLGRLDPADLPDESLISAVTLAELSVGPHATDDPAERAARQAHLQQAEADFTPLAFDARRACPRSRRRLPASRRSRASRPRLRRTHRRHRCGGGSADLYLQPR